tara:strand:- start:9 stop:563 length:555 start_codon:yes stop_codon:yes gene_type:complete
MTNQTEHTFTISGLGKAPFRFSGFDEKSDSCRHCGAAIHNRFHIVSADGIRSVVGSTCVSKTGDKGLIDIVKAETNRRKREKAQAKSAAECAAFVQAQRDANGGLTDWEVDEKERIDEHAALIKKLKPVIDLADDLQDGRGGFRDTVAGDLRRGNLPSPKGIAIVCKILGADAEAAFKKVGLAS